MLPFPNMLPPPGNLLVEVFVSRAASRIERGSSNEGQHRAGMGRSTVRKQQHDAKQHRMELPGMWIGWERDST